MMYEYPIEVDDFDDVEDKVLCAFCENNLADLTDDSDTCTQCKTIHGEVCSKEGCMADTFTTTADGRVCERHASEYLIELVSQAFHMRQSLSEEMSVIADKINKMHDNPDLEQTDPAGYQHTKYTLDQMKASHSSRIDALGSLVSDIDELQEELDVQLMHTEY